MIRVEQLSLSFGDVQALDGLSLHVEAGSFFGLLGPNGAGKSSAINCIAGLLQPQQGRVFVDGIDLATDPQAARRSLGLVPQSLALFPDLSVEENLNTFAGLHGLPRAQHKARVQWGLDLAQLGEKRRARAETLSGGMARRLNLACGLLHDPKVIICDEPTAGVDPQSRNHLFDMLRHLHGEGRTIVYTTHYMEEVEALCDQVAIMDRGKVIARDALPNLVASATDGSQPGADFSLSLTAPQSLSFVQAQLEAAGLEFTDLRAPRRTLEDVFLELTGRSLRDGGSAHAAPEAKPDA